MLTFKHFFDSFNAEDEDFFTSSIRSRIVDFILKRKRFKEEIEDEFAFGIERLLTEGIYSAAYPLHDVMQFFFYYYLFLICLISGFYVVTG
jgi:hypothetical protein